MAKRSEMSKFMEAEAAKEKAKKKLRKEFKKQESIEKETAEEEVQTEEAAPEAAPAPVSALSKATGLVFFRQYNTYQVLLEIHPKEGMNASACFSKTVLHIMKWFRKRLGENAFEEYPEVLFLKEEYPEPEEYVNFAINQTKDINGLDFIELETAYLAQKNAWLFCLTEPDNGNDKEDIQGRTFTTEIMVYQLKQSAVLGVRLSCREPRTNSKDANVYRPAFIKALYMDEDLRISEYGLPEKYYFNNKPAVVNGKSLEDCTELYDNLIVSGCRQMPVLFVPDKFYEENEEEVNQKTESLLGFCHVVVWQNACRKLFMTVMKNEELADVAEEGQLILYRSTYLHNYSSDYYETDEDFSLEKIKDLIKREPLRKQCDFKEFAFKPSWWEVSKSETGSLDAEELRKRHEAEIDRLNIIIRERQRDNDELQRKLDSLEKDYKKLEDENDNKGKMILEDFQENAKLRNDIDDLNADLRKEKDAKKKSEKELRTLNEKYGRLILNTKKIFEPLINLPDFGRNRKDDILEWIRRYYSDVLIIHPNAEKSFRADNRNIDMHRFCMMIHYIAGYTAYLNDGGIIFDEHAAREYDPENAAYKATPSSSGAGGAEMYKDAYTVSMEGKKGVKMKVQLDQHVKFGKGSDSSMLRIYFAYLPDEKKSVLGYMPGHLPTRKDSH